MNNEFYKNLLLNRKKEIINNLKQLSVEISDNTKKCEIGDEIDYANFNMNSNINYEITEKLTEELEEINEALKKIENGLYGICEMCEEEIEKERLKIKPHAKYCIICREIVEKEKT